MSAASAAAAGVPAGTGAAVTGVLAGSPASRAGLAAGDVIVFAAGQSVTSPQELQSALERRHPGDSVTIRWTSQTGQTQSATITLATGPPA
jgi:S1-C subfamily serine protease